MTICLSTYEILFPLYAVHIFINPTRMHSQPYLRLQMFVFFPILLLPGRLKKLITECSDRLGKYDILKYSR